MSPGDRVHLAPIDGGEPEVVEYRGQIGGYAVVIGANRIQFMVPAERVSPLPFVAEGQTLPPECP